MIVVHAQWDFYWRSSSAVIYSWSECLQHGCHSHLQKGWKKESREL